MPRAERFRHFSAGGGKVAVSGSCRVGLVLMKERQNPVPATGNFARSTCVLGSRNDSMY
jgi:hypothetical protein